MNGDKLELVVHHYTPNSRNQLFCLIATPYFYVSMWPKQSTLGHRSRFVVYTKKGFEDEEFSRTKMKNNDIYKVRKRQAGDC